MDDWWWQKANIILAKKNKKKRKRIFEGNLNYQTEKYFIKIDEVC